MPLIVINNISDAWVTIAYSDCLSCCFSGTWNQSCPIWLSWDHWQFIWAHVNVWWSFDVKGPKTPPENMLIPSISDQASSEEACNSDKSVQSSNYLNFFLPPVTIPCTSKHHASLSHKNPESLALEEAHLRFALPSSWITASRIKSFFCCVLPCLSIWLTGCCTNQPGSVTLWCFLHLQNKGLRTFV